MNAGAYTNRGEEVPLGVECALPYLADSTPRTRQDLQSAGRCWWYSTRAAMASPVRAEYNPQQHFT